MSKTLLAFSLAVLSLAPALHAQSHPMDALTGPEIRRTAQILRDRHLVDPAGRFPLITLKEPAKAAVLAWQAGQPVPRSAFVIVKEGTHTFEAVVDLTAGVVSSWTEIPGVQPSVLLEEFFGATALVAEDPEFLAGLARRGLTTEQVFCAPLSAGYFGTPEEEGHRLLRISCFDVSEGSNLLARPIGGLYAVADTNSGEVLEVIDEGVRPTPPELAEYTQSSIHPLRPPLKPVVQSQPLGVNFTADGNVVRWQKWTLHHRLDRRLGLVISLVSYRDGGRERPVMYQGSLSELFVPYQTDDPNWYYRTFMDAGEYGFGGYASPLAPGLDCPETAMMVDAVLPDDTGGSYRLPNAVAVFERNTGDPAWRHFDPIYGLLESRPAVELVVRSIATVGNYDYIMDWIFTQDGRMRLTMSATGIDLPEAVKAATMSDPTAAAETRYGTLVAPNLVAHNHDHWFSFRLDLDVDGTENTFIRGDLEKVAFENSPRKSGWKVVRHAAATESQAQLDAHGEIPGLWTVVNASRKNALGNPVGYELEAGDSAEEMLMSADDYPTKRAGFTAHNLWVTPYSPDELYAAGTYVNQSKGGEGLPAWTAADRPIEDRDIVLWYTLGFHHVPRAEDWPIMPLERHSFELRPANFFDRSPIMDLRQGFKRPPS
jgi:primary-amine oxidase